MASKIDIHHDLTTTHNSDTYRWEKGVLKIVDENDEKIESSEPLYLDDILLDMYLKLKDWCDHGGYELLNSCSYSEFSSWVRYRLR